MIVNNNYNKSIMGHFIRNLEHALIYNTKSFPVLHSFPYHEHCRAKTGDSGRHLLADREKEGADRCLNLSPNEIEPSY